jgi:hypothetical protein
MLRPECWNEGDGIMSGWGVMGEKFSSRPEMAGHVGSVWMRQDYRLPTTSYQLPTPWNPAASLFRGGYF